MDGYEVCRRLKADERAREIPIMFITGKRGVDDEIRGFNLGAVDYIAKPISPPIVRARVKNYLELKRARQQLEEQNKILLEAVQLREDVEQMTRHDLKNPLNAILSYPQLIEMVGELNDQQRQFLRAIETAGYRILNMINRSLDLVKNGTRHLYASIRADQPSSTVSDDYQRNSGICPSTQALDGNCCGCAACSCG
jgi:CheY-like chemotaxis protein